VKTLPVVCEDLLGDPVGVERFQERVAHRASRSSRHHPGDDAEAGAVVDPGDDRDTYPGGELDSSQDVELPQLHQSGPFPALVVVAPATSGLGLDQAVAHETAIDRRPRRRVLELASQPVEDVAGAPAGVGSA
jgi:hypothetical protein